MRTLLKIAVSAAALLSAAGCLPDDAPVLITSINFVTGDSAEQCKISDVGMTSGSWDVSSPQVFTAAASIVNQTGPTVEPGSFSGDEIHRTTPNDFLATKLLLDYASNPSIGLPATDFVPVTMTVPQGGTSFLFNEPFFGTKAAEAARNGVAPGDVVEVNVGIRIEGRFRSSTTTVQTNRVVFPVTLRASGTTCTATQVPAQNGPCGEGGGINGVPLICCNSTDTACITGS